MTYMGSNPTASPNLHVAAFFERVACEIRSYMARKHKNYIREWRKKAGYTQKEVIDRLREMANGEQADPDLRIPQTEASLSRIEGGTQNFSMATLAALAVVLGADEPGWLLDRNPQMEGEVVDLWGFKLDKEDAELARRVITQMFGSGGAA
jgi:transcriptional regulator with XRE-family HTH domain